MNIVMLDRSTIGMDVDVNIFKDFGNFKETNSLGPEETREFVKDAEVIIFNKTKVNRELIDSAKNLKLLCVTATGTDNIDVDYANQRGIAVSNVRNYSTDAVAMHTITMALFLQEKLSYYDEYVKSGKYSKGTSFCNFDELYCELTGKTWGIIGLGNIGKKVAKVAEAFDCRVVYYSTTGNNNNSSYEKVDFDTFLAESDILSIHCPLNNITRNLINKEALKKMKNTATLINVARGPIVNEEDLAWALQNNIIGAAGLDVLETEPMREDNPLCKIKDSRKLIITPHMAWASVEARNRCIQEVYKNIESFTKGVTRNKVE